MWFYLFLFLYFSKCNNFIHLKAEACSVWHWFGCYAIITYRGMRAWPFKPFPDCWPSFSFLLLIFEEAGCCSSRCWWITSARTNTMTPLQNCNGSLISLLTTAHIDSDQVLMTLFCFCRQKWASWKSIRSSPWSEKHHMSAWLMTAIVLV